jgi:hypothetical protein
MLIHAGIEHETRETTTTEHVTLSNSQIVEVECRWEVTLARFDQSHGPGLTEHTTERDGCELVFWEASPVPPGFETETEKLINKQAPAWAEEVTT